MAQTLLERYTFSLELTSHRNKLRINIYVDHVHLVHHVHRTSCAQVHDLPQTIVVITGRAFCLHDNIYNIYIYIYTHQNFNQTTNIQQNKIIN